jgi:hypothetical protein
MAGLSTYPNSNRPTSALVGYAILQAYVQGYLTNSNVTSATSADDLIANVNAAVVTPGGEADAQRNAIARALKVGQGLGDLSDARVAAATSANDLALTYTWVSDDANASVTGHLGPNLITG